MLWTMALAALLGPGSVRAEDDSPKVILERAIEAHGGRKKLEGVKADWVTVKGKLWIGERAVEFHGETIVQLPAQFKTVLTLAGDRKTTIVQVLDGDTAWVSIDGTPQARIPSAALEEMKAVRHLDRVTRLVPLLDEKTYELVSNGTAKVGDREALGITVKARGQRPVKLYFDKAKGVLLKTEHSLDDSKDKEIKQEELYSDFKDYASSRRPTKMVVYRDGKKTMEAELVEVRYYEKIEASVFAKP
jgi:hypothetical protein